MSRTAAAVRRSTQLVVAVLCIFSTTLARAESESSVKATYLLNFAKLVEWPSSAFSSSKAPLVLGVVGRGSTGDEVARAFSGASANGHPIEVRRVSASDSGALQDCHVLFVLESENSDGVIGAVRGRPVLVVGESENFAGRGGALGFVKVDGTLKFDANPKAASRNGVTVSSKLLRVARVVVER